MKWWPRPRRCGPCCWPDAAKPDEASEATAQGGPFQSLRAAFDPKFKALFLGWKRLDPMQPGMIAIPSAKPVPAAQARFTSAICSNVHASRC